jgi:hypothetical protein
MSTINEIMNTASGLDYIIRQSKNRDLAKNALGKLVSLRQQVVEANTRDSLVERIDSYIENGIDKIGFSAIDASDIFEQTPTSLGILLTFLAYLVFVLAISVYVSTVQKTLNSTNYGKN